MNPMNSKEPLFNHYIHMGKLMPAGRKSRTGRINGKHSASLYGVHRMCDETAAV